MLTVGKRAATLLAALLASTAALAEPPPPGLPAPSALPDKHDPVPSPQDGRIRTFPADPGNTMRVTTPGLNPVRVILAPGSANATVAGAFVSSKSDKATDWFVTSAGNTLIIQPLHKGIPTSIMFVTAQRDGDQDNYVIELRVGDGDLSDPDDKRAYVQVTYVYKPAEAPGAAEARARALRQRTEGMIDTSIAQARFGGPRNWHYKKVGEDCDQMTPRGMNWVSDDGHQTTLLFPPHMAAPSFSSRESDDDRDESLITPIPTFARAGTLFTLPDVYRQIVLRRAHKVCALKPERYDDQGTQPGGGSGTISSDVIRVMAPRRNK